MSTVIISYGYKCLLIVCLRAPSRWRQFCPLLRSMFTSGIMFISTFFITSVIAEFTRTFDKFWYVSKFQFVKVDVVQFHLVFLVVVSFFFDTQQIIQNYKMMVTIEICWFLCDNINSLEEKRRKKRNRERKTECHQLRCLLFMRFTVK